MTIIFTTKCNSIEEKINSTIRCVQIYIKELKFTLKELEYKQKLNHQRMILNELLTDYINRK